MSMTQQLAPMDQRRGAAVLVVTGVLVVVGLIIFALSRRNGDGDNGNGDQGMAIPAASIAVMVDPSSRQVLHGNNVRGSYTVTFDTKNSEGTPIAWPYEWELHLVRSSAPFIVASRWVLHGYSNPANPGTASNDFTLSTDGADPGDSLSLVGTIKAPRSDAQGQPVVVNSTQWDFLDDAIADDGIIVLAGAAQNIAFRVPSRYAL